MKRLPRTDQIIHYFAGYNLIGTILGFFAIYIGFLPSLLPRGWVLQGIISGVVFAIGYGLGLVISYIIREFKPTEPVVTTKQNVKSSTYKILAVLYVFFLFQGYNWQKQVSSLVDQPAPRVTNIVGVVLATLFTIVLVMLAARSSVTLYRWIRRQILRVIPASLARSIAIVLTVLLIVGLLNGVVFNTVREAINSSFSVRNGTTDVDVTKPTVPELGGSKESLIPWDTLGRQGRTFIDGGQDTKKLSEFNKTPAIQPVRVYSGLESAPDTTSRAELAVKDLKRAGGFDRKVLVVISTTGTGWVDEQGVQGVEYMYNGDSAMVAMQYSYLPSWLSFLVDQSKAQDAGIELYNAVLAEWQKLPADQRPKLVVFGESLGSFGGESAFTGWSAFKATSNGAVWVGPPNFNSLWHKTTADRDKGAPEILPVVDNGQTVRYAAKADDLTKQPTTNWQTPRAAYLQNPSDPIVWWSPDLLFTKPDWLNETRGADVSTATRWVPVVTFLQVSGDMVFSTGVPDNHGHKYGTMPTEAWSYVAPPDGWTQQKTQDLRNFLAE